MPSQSGCSSPKRSRSSTTRCARSAGIAKPMPSAPRAIAVLMPITWPSRLTSGPPELPGLIEASVCRKSVNETRPSPPPDGAAARREHAGGHRVGEAERVADRDHRLAHHQVARAPERRRGEPLAGYLEHREVGVAIGAQNLRFELAAVAHGDEDPRRPFDDVIVGDDETGAVDDQARAQRLAGARAAGVSPAEERVDLAHDRFGGDVHHRRRDAFDRHHHRRAPRRASLRRKRAGGERGGEQEEEKSGAAPHRENATGLSPAVAAAAGDAVTRRSQRSGASGRFFNSRTARSAACVRSCTSSLPSRIET